MYKDTIPLYNHYWWLRSPGNCDSCVAYIRRDGKIDHDGTDSDYIGGCIRPALRVIGSTYLEIGERFIKYDFPWIYLGDNLAIAEVPIANNRFDSNNNDYKNSEIRQFLKNWLEARKL